MLYKLTTIYKYLIQNYTLWSFMHERATTIDLHGGIGHVFDPSISSAFFREIASLFEGHIVR